MIKGKKKKQMEHFQFSSGRLCLTMDRGEKRVLWPVPLTLETWELIDEILRVKWAYAKVYKTFRP